jgi:hypothetical protein
MTEINRNKVMSLTENEIQVILGDNEIEIISLIQRFNNTKHLKIIIDIAMKHDKHFPINYILDQYDYIRTIKISIFIHGNVHFFTIMNQQNEFNHNSYYLKIAIQNIHNNRNEFIIEHLSDWLTNKQKLFTSALTEAVACKNIYLVNYLLTTERFVPLLTRKAMSSSFKHVAKMEIEMFEMLTTKYLEL